jgi:hypothetical protein
MADLIVLEKIDGTAVAWRCSDCRQKFSVRGKFTSKERQKIINAEFSSHIEAGHKFQFSPAEMALAAASVSWPD